MNWLKKLHNRIRSLSQKRALDRDLDDEIRTHIELRTQENIAQGMDPKEARYAALRQFGWTESIKETCRDERESFVTHHLSLLTQDICFGARQLRKNPGFTAVAVLTLALGIGANTAIFSVLDAILLKMLPVRNPEQLRALNHAGGDRRGNGFPYPVFERLRDGNRAFSDLCGFLTWPELTVTINGQDETLTSGALLVSGEYYDTLGIRPFLGRLISAEDNRVPGGHPVAVLSHGFWKRKFGGDRSAIGRSIGLNGTSYTVIGVTPPEFFGVRVGRSDAVTVPIMMEPRMMPGALFLQEKKNWDVEIMGRLNRGQTEAQAMPGLRVLFQQIELEMAGGNPAPDKLKIIQDRRIELGLASQGLSALRHQFSESLRILMGVVGLVLLVACANVANLLLSRATARRKEIAVRLALGAGRVRLMRQLLTESALLAGLGGVAGLFFAKWVGRLCVTLIPDRGGSIDLNLSLDGRVLGFAAFAALLTGIVFGLAPAWQATQIPISPALMQSAGTGGPASRRFWLGRGLAAFQVALSLVLLVGAGLFLRTFQKLKTVDAGFVSENLILFSLDTRMRGSSPEKAFQLFHQLEERIRALPGVVSATLSRDGNFGGGGRTRTTISATRGDVSSDTVHHDAFEVPAGPRFFETLGAPLLRGRGFTLQDDAFAPKVAIISERLARALFGKADPIGQRIGVGTAGDTVIIGIAKDTKLASLREGAPYVMYRSYLQTGPPRRMTFAVRTAVPPAAMMATLRREMDSYEPNLPLFGFTTLQEVVDKSLASERLFATLSSLFGVVALTLAAAGLYGVMAYSISQRTREIALRIALGAPSRSVLALIIGQGAKVVLVGLGVGGMVALGVTRFIASRLYGVTPTDPLVLWSVSGLLAFVALVACYVPARRAMKVDPMEALRYE